MTNAKPTRPTRSKRCRAISRAAGLVVMLGGVVVGGCGTHPDPGASPMAQAARTALVPTGPGVQVQALAVRGAGAAIARALAPHEAAGEGDEASRSTWARGGLRVIVLPEDQARALFDELSARAAVVRKGQGLDDTPVIAGIREQTIGQGAPWTEVVRGPKRGARTVGLHDSRLAVPARPLRLLGRCWLTPDPRGPEASAPAAALRLELVPQVFDPKSRDDLSLQGPTTRLAHEQGQTLWRLRGGLTLTRGQAVVIVGEDPGTNWAEGPAKPDTPPARPLRRGQVGPSGDEPATPAAPAREAVGPSAQPAPAGPWTAEVRSLGEDMLVWPATTDDAPEGPDGSIAAAPGTASRLVIFVWPSIPETYSLLGGS